MIDILTGTSFSGGLSYSAANGDPVLNMVNAHTDDSIIGVNIKGTIFKWDWTLPVGDTPALMIETPLKFPQ
jgi:hypothetical protein